MTPLCRAICRVEHYTINIGANRDQLTLEEFCPGKVKLQMRNAAPDTIAEIRQRTDRGFARLRKRPDLLLNFFHLAGLKLKQLWSWATP